MSHSYEAESIVGRIVNEIEADVDGTVVEIYPRNAQPVEFGEPLFAIKT